MMKIIKNNRKKIILTLISMSTIIIFISLIYNTFYNINNIPIGEFMQELQSPDKEYSLKSYLYNGGATVALAVRVELIDNNTKKSKNIYWDYKMDKAEMEWLDNDTIIINEKRLNIHKDKYDWRKNK